MTRQQLELFHKIKHSLWNYRDKARAMRFPVHPDLKVAWDSVQKLQDTVDKEIAESFKPTAKKSSHEKTR
jgi:hypothetical protein